MEPRPVRPEAPCSTQFPSSLLSIGGHPGSLKPGKEDVAPAHPAWLVLCASSASSLGCHQNAPAQGSLLRAGPSSPTFILQLAATSPLARGAPRRAWPWTSHCSCAEERLMGVGHRW